MRSATGKLAAVDEANLVLDHVGQVNVFLVAAILEPGGFVGSDGGVDPAALRAGLRDRIAALPSLRRFPAAAGRAHRWVEAPPDLEHHIRVTAPVDGLQGLERRCGELMSVPLALDAPPWELLVVPGASAGRPAVVLRIHHVIADGMAAVAILQQLFEEVEPDAPSAPPLAEASRRPVPVLPAPVLPVPVLPGLAPAAPVDRGRHPLRVLGKLGFGVRRVVTTLAGRGIGTTVLLGDRGPDRGVVFADADLAALERRVRPLGATANDALLAAVAAGCLAALSAAGERPPAELPVSVPVALPRRGSSSNQVGVMRVLLPLGEPDPDERLRAIAARTRAEKARAREQGTLELMRGPWSARILDLVTHRQHVVAGFVTNVRGPSGRRRLAGAPIAAIWPVAVLAGNVRLGVAAVSYAGRLWCGIHFDAATVPGAVFARAMQRELARLTA